MRNHQVQSYSSWSVEDCRITCKRFVNKSPEEESPTRVAHMMHIRCRIMHFRSIFSFPSQVQMWTAPENVMGCTLSACTSKQEEHHATKPNLQSCSEEYVHQDHTWLYSVAATNMVSAPESCRSGQSDQSDQKASKDAKICVGATWCVS